MPKAYKFYWNLKQQLQQKQELVEVEEARTTDPLTCTTIRGKERETVVINMFPVSMYGFFLLFG